MELKAKGVYHSSFGSLYEGGTTCDKGFPEEIKVKMLEDFPELFEKVSAKDKPAASKESEVTVETSEDKLQIETPELKMGKSRKK